MSSVWWGYLKSYVSHTSVWAKQLTENRDEHLSLTRPRGGKGAVIIARPQKKDCFPKSAFCTRTVCNSP